MVEEERANRNRCTISLAAICKSQVSTNKTATDLLTQPRTRYFVEPCIQKLPLIIIRYRDIGELMKRCETLVVTRDESKSALKRLEAEIVSEEEHDQSVNGQADRNCPPAPKLFPQ